MHVLKTTSPWVEPCNGAANSVPSNVAPDSNARIPRRSCMRPLLFRNGHPRIETVHDAAAGDRQQHAAAQLRADPRSVVRTRTQGFLAHRPRGVRVEEDAGRGLSDAPTRLGRAA